MLRQHMIHRHSADEAGNDTLRENIRAKVRQYLDRAEKLKKFRNQKEDKKAVADGDKGGKNSDSDDDGDPEKKKLQERLSGVLSTRKRRCQVRTLQMQFSSRGPMCDGTTLLVWTVQRRRSRRRLSCRLNSRIYSPVSGAGEV